MPCRWRSPKTAARTAESGTAATPGNPRFRRTGWVALAAGALDASLFAVGAAPAAALDEDSKQDYAPKMTACLGEAMTDRGFTDLGTLDEAARSINCLAYCGITVGRTADTFDPNSNVTRRHMALFLYRAAKLMGVELMGGDMSADFGDISELGEDMQSAITALARNGILAGRGDMAFDPFADITRVEMAVALVALLDHTPGAPVQKNKAGLFTLGADASSAQEPNDHFADARASVPRAVDNAISAAYELGVTSGTGDGNFSPHASGPRRDMATFIIRALAHSNVRPAGLTAQLSGAEITVSVRGGAPRLSPGWTSRSGQGSRHESRVARSERPHRRANRRYTNARRPRLSAGSSSGLVVLEGRGGAEARVNPGSVPSCSYDDADAMVSSNVKRVLRSSSSWS